MRLPVAIERVLTEMSARYGIDVGGMAAGVRSRLESRLPLSPLQVDADLDDRTSRLGVGKVRCSAFEAPRLRKIVLSEVKLFPVLEGFALTLLPRHEVTAPVFAADFMLLPAALSVNVDVYGTPAATQGVLRTLGPTFAGLDTRQAAPWARALTAGEGLHAKVSPRLVGEAYGALTAALGAYLDALTSAREDQQGDEQAAFFRLMHAHGPRRRVRMLFGDAWAERYSRLLFE